MGGAISSLAPTDRVILGGPARFVDVAELAVRCALVESHRLPQVFPAREEPARVVWMTPDGLPCVQFDYLVDPDRRFLSFGGPDAEALRRAFVCSLGEVTAAEVEAALVAGDERVAFVAAFLVTALPVDRAQAALVRACRTRDDDGGEGAIRALEIAGDATTVPILRAIEYDAARPAPLRLLARHVANALAARPPA